MKKFLSIMLTVLMVVTMIPLSVLPVSAAPVTSAYAPTREENYFNDDDAIFANGTAITIEAATNGTRIWYMDGNTKKYVTKNGANGEDLSSWDIFAGSDDIVGMSGVDGYITMTGGNVGAVYAGQHYYYFSGTSNITITGGTVGYISCNACRMNSVNDYVKTVTIYDATGAYISEGGGKADNVVQKNGTEWSVSGNGIVPSGVTLTVNEGETLTVPADSTLTNNGTIINNGTVILSSPLLGNDITGSGNVIRNAVYVSGITNSTDVSVYADGVEQTKTTELLNNNLYVYDVPAGNVRVTVNGTNYYGVYSGSGELELDSAYVAVSDLSGIPESISANKEVTLSAYIGETTLPQLLTYEIVDNGNTGAVLKNDTTLFAYGAGTVTIKVTASDYYSTFSKEFSIDVTHIPVTALDGELPAEEWVNTNIPLPTLTISPEDATFQTIVWSVVDAGGTKARISNGNLSAKYAGTAKIRASVAHGKAFNTAYTKDFSVTFKATDEIDLSLADVTIVEKDEQTVTVEYAPFESGSKDYAIDELIYITGTTTDHYVKVSSGYASIVLNNVSITETGYAFHVASGATADLTLVGNNVLNTTGGYAALSVPSGATVLIDGDGTLSTSSSGTPGIGSGRQVSGIGTIVINGGIVTATSDGYEAAGIGGSYGKKGGNIIINGGIVTATGGDGAPGIGVGPRGNGMQITINGGTIIAKGGVKSGKGAAGIGGSYYDSSGGTIVITGGNIKATAGTSTAEAIGNGDNYTEDSTLSDGNGNDISLQTITLSGVAADTAVTKVEGTTYGLTDVKTLDTDKLYFWLPADTAVTSITAGGNEYICNSNLTYYAAHNWSNINGICANGCGTICSHENETDHICSVCGRHIVECTYADNGDGTHSFTCTLCYITSTENHTGGTATCKEQAACEACNASYGDLDPNIHASSEFTYAANEDGTTHKKLYECCNVVAVEAENHTGGTATCTTPASCELCSENYGELDPDNHEYEKNNGICCATYQPAVDSDSDGYYEIGNAGQLFWYANYVNTVDRTANAVLTADIDLEGRPWTPIGSTGENSNNFRGIFDGQNHTIEGLYVEGGRAGLGFFGEVRTGTVKNFTIYGEVVANTEVDYIGGVIGSVCGVNGDNDLERNGAIIQNITSYVNLTAKAHGIGKIGGFVGYANHQSLIENCSWYGTFDAGIYRVDSGAGGFIGKIQENTSEVTIRNCGAYGTIKTNYAGDYNNTATIYMGGFLSFTNTNAKTTLENCLFAGKFERGANLTDEAFLGAFGTVRSVNAIVNCYYLGDDGLEAVHSDSNLKPGSDNVEITKVTAEQLRSGEIAYKLQGEQTEHVWGQNIGTDNYPVLGGEKVYYGYTSCADEVMVYSNDSSVSAANPAHVWGEGVLTRPTKTEEGYYTYTCTACGEATKTEEVERAANYADYTKALNDLRAYLDSDMLTDENKSNISQWLAMYDSDEAYSFIAGEEATVQEYIDATAYYASEFEAAIEDCLAGNHSGNGDYCEVCGAYIHICDFTGEWKYDADKHWKECECGLLSEEGTHIGGEATCTTQAVCTTCGTQYGDFSKTNHTFDNTCCGYYGAEGNEQSVWWTLVDGTLTIGGTGAMADKHYTHAPWYNSARSITALVVQEGVTHIGENSFRFCGFMNSVNIPASVETIGSSAFMNCSYMKEVTFAAGSRVTELGDSVFQNTGLEQITIPASVTSIGDLAFDLNNNLTDIFVDEGNTSYKDIDGVLYTTDGTLVLYPINKAATEFTTPEDVTKIAAYAFCGNKNLVTITLSEGVTTIEEAALANCESLQTLTIPASVTAIAKWSLDSDYNIVTVNLPCNWDGSLYTFEDEYVTLNYSDHVADETAGQTCKGYKCTACGAFYGEVAADNHDIVIDEAVAPDCINTGLTEGEHCTRCDYKVAQEIVPALNHKNTLVQVDAKAPTCTEIGWDAYEYCTECDYTTYAEKEALDHDIVIDEAVAPKCDETGLTQGQHCSRCDAMTVIQEIVPATNHKDTLVQVEAQAPTCTEIGWDAYEYCTACDYTTYKEIPASHSIVTVEKKDATCTEAGHEAYEYCTACDYTTYKEIPASHSIVTVEKKDATCTEAGYEAYEYCTACDYTTYKEIPVAGHTEETVKGYAATCTKAGLTDGVKCSVCDAVITAQQTIDQLAHKDEDGDFLCDYGCGHEYEKPAEPDTPDTPDEPTDEACDHLCHKDGILGFLWKIISFFYRLFNIQQYCDCGEIHYDAPVFG